MRTYSDGMRLRLAFGVIAQLEPDALLLDEVIAVGDLRFQAKCMDHIRELRERGTAVLFASHDLDKVAEECSRAVWLQAGGVRTDGRRRDRRRRVPRGDALRHRRAHAGAGGGARTARWSCAATGSAARSSRSSASRCSTATASPTREVATGDPLRIVLELRGERARRRSDRRRRRAPGGRRGRLLGRQHGDRRRAARAASRRPRSRSRSPASTWCRASTRSIPASTAATGPTRSTTTGRPIRCGSRAAAEGTAWPAAAALGRARVSGEVTVVIPTRDRPALLADALASVAAPGPPAARTLVVDDGSAAAAAVPAGGAVEVVRAGRAGVSAARNRGLAARRDGVGRVPRRRRPVGAGQARAAARRRDAGGRLRVVRGRRRRRPPPAGRRGPGRRPGGAAAAARADQCDRQPVGGARAHRARARGRGVRRAARAAGRLGPVAAPRRGGARRRQPRGPCRLHGARGQHDRHGARRGRSSELARMAGKHAALVAAHGGRLGGAGARALERGRPPPWRRAASAPRARTSPPGCASATPAAWCARRPRCWASGCRPAARAPRRRAGRRPAWLEPYRRQEDAPASSAPIA